MCGIATLFSYRDSAPKIDRSELRRIRQDMVQRGPDDAGEWISKDERIGLAHTRLSIIDLSPTGAQPMKNNDGTIIVSFNGEIYNYKELRNDLEKKGVNFKSNSDTEIILHLYAQHGREMVCELRGMFAFALWDDRQKTLLLARDPYGIKPLYYANDGQTIRAASQVRALLKGNISREADPAGICGFFLFGSIPEPLTMYDSIRELPAGCTMAVSSRGAEDPKSYFSIPEAFLNGASESKQNSGSLILREALYDSVKYHLVADVPVGIFLSAGLDSGTLAGLSAEIQPGLQALTLAYDKYNSNVKDESVLAQKVASQYGLKHSVRVLTQAEFKNNIHKFFEAMDQPTIDGVNTYFVSKAAKELGWKVAISGVGGDELLGGYPSFRQIPKMNRIASLLSMFPQPTFENVYASVMQPLGFSAKGKKLLKYAVDLPGTYFLKRGLFLPDELPAILGEDMVVEGLKKFDPVSYVRAILNPEPARLYGQIASLESSIYMRNQLLRDTDWAGMAHSLEIRTPFVDASLLRTVAPLLAKSQGSKKDLLKSVLNQPLSSEVLNRQKTGFSVPIDQWLESDTTLDAWKQIPSLRRSHWSRKWAYMVYFYNKSLN